MFEIFNNTFLLLGGLVLVLLYVYFHITYSYWKKRGVPYIKPIAPFGNLAGAFLPNVNPMVHINNFYSHFKGERLGGIYRFSTPAIVLRDPELIKNILVKDFSHFYGRGMEANIEANPLAGNLFLLSGPKWRQLRIKLTPTFTSGKMKMMFPIVVETGKELKDLLEKPASKQEAIEIKDILSRYNTDVIASCAFGIQCNCLKDPDADFSVWGKRIFTPTFKITTIQFLLQVAPFLSKILTLPMMPEDTSDYFRKVVRDTVEYREMNNIHRKDFMHLLIQMKNKTLGMVEEDDLIKTPDAKVDGLHASEPFEVTMDVLAAQAFVFFIAGFETSSATMTFCLYEMALNPDIQDRLRAEIDDMLENTNGELQYDEIMKLEYLDKVINETLRKYPPVRLLTRECTKTTPLRGTNLVVEKGTPIMLPIYALHHDPQYFPDPERFDPERFSEEEKKKRPHFCYLPFGEGPRLCIGMRFGLMQTKVGLISVLSNYEFHVSEKTQVPTKFDSKSFVISPEGGMWLKITQRKNKSANK